MKRKKAIAILGTALCVISVVIVLLFCVNDSSVSSHEEIALLGTIKLKSFGGEEYVKIYSCFQKEGLMWLTVESKIPEKITKENVNSVFKIKSKNGNAQNISLEDIICDEETTKQLAILKFPTQDRDGREYTFTYNGNDLPILLTEVDVNNSQYRLKNYEQKEGITIAAFPKYEDQKAEVSISVSGKDIVSYTVPAESVSVYDIEGNQYSVSQGNGHVIKISDAKFADDLYLRIGNMEVEYEGGVVEKNEEWCISLKY